MPSEITATVPPSDKQIFPIVGIGASAGGLDAFKRFISAIPAQSGMAYVFVQHLAPAYESMLPEILRKSSAIPVHEITDDLNIEVNHLYIIPENQILTVDDDVLKLAPRDASIRINKPIDIFFRSLAETHKSYAIAIVMSGTGFDGSVGIKAIKEHGGITYAQSPESSIFDTMPQNAISSGSIDFILPPEDMPAHIMHVVKAYGENAAYDDESEISTDDDIFRSILRVLSEYSGNDFTNYKTPTLRRRIARRLVATKNELPKDYLRYLRSSDTEKEILFNDVLIPVSYFFRDTQIFDNFRNNIIPDVLSNKKPTDDIRVWVAGCSSGEEAYSIAISVHEKLPDSWRGKIQIFASDVSPVMVSKARTGIYSQHELQNVNERQVSTYFTKMEGGYHVNKMIRDMCVFTVHNFLKDPPFARMDIVSCRNVLIYFDPFLQKKAITTFHYALRENGVLFLGKSETIGEATNLFEPLIHNQKIFKRKRGLSRLMPNLFEPSTGFTGRYKTGRETLTPESDSQRLANEILFKKYTPVGVIINKNNEIIHFHGETGDILIPPPGKPNFNILKMSRKELEFPLRKAIDESLKANKTINSSIIPLNQLKFSVSFEVIPLSIADPHFLVIFNKHQSAGRQFSAGSEAAQERITELEAELTQLREDIRRISEQQDAANEQLQSANEELLSTSEELQSLNEELETSSEELQSNNEELLSVNDELLDRQEQLITARKQAEAIVETIRGPLLIIDGSMRVKSANRAYYKYFDTSERETEGRLLFDIASQWSSSELEALVQDLMNAGPRIEDYEIKLQVPMLGERAMLLNVTKIENERQPEGWILLAFEDITDHRLTKMLQESEKRFRVIANSVPVLIWMSDEHQMRTFFNKAWLEYTGRTVEQEYGMGWQENVHPEDLEECLNIINTSFEAQSGFTMEYRLRRHDGVYRWLSANCVPRFSSDGAFRGFVGGCMDVHEQMNFSAALQEQVNQHTKVLRESESFLQSVLDTTQNLIYIYDLTANKIVFVNKKAIEAIGLTTEQITTSDKDLFTDLIHESDRDAVLKHRKELQGAPDGKMIPVEYRLRTGDGEYTNQLSRDLVFKRDKKGVVTQYLGVSTDITEIKKTNELLLSKNDELAHSNDELASFSSIASHDLKEPLRKIQMFSKLIVDHERSNMSEKTQAYLDRVIISAKRMQQLIDDLISYSRNNSEQIVLIKTDLNEIMDQVLEDLQETMEEKQATVEVCDLPEAPILASQFRQLFHNLISNAIKYTDKDTKPHVKVELAPITDADITRLKLTDVKEWCKITVTDNGIGFSNEYSARIFEPFKRLHGKDEYSGTGIGLAICKKIMANHNGHIFAESEPGKGSVFSIFLPLTNKKLNHR